MRVIRIPQVGRGTRLVAVTDADAEMVRRDRAMIDAVDALGVLDIDRDGGIMWAPAGPQRISKNVRAMLRAAAQG